MGAQLSIQSSQRQRGQLVSCVIRAFWLLVTYLIIALSATNAIAASGPPLMVVPGQFNVSSTGAATYSIPISVPPGTSGVVPVLSLAYSSQGGDGFVGLGWSLVGLPSISRCPRTLAQDGVHGSVNYDSNDQFCLSGQRLIATGTATLCSGSSGNLYHTEIESFSRIISCGSSGSGPAYFKVWTKAGQIMEFGNTSDSQALVIPVVSGTPPAGTVREWMVNKISDVVGNYMTVTYSCAPTGGNCVSGEAYPIRIDYTGHSSPGVSVSPYNSVQFTYTARGDSVPMYQAGGLVQPTVVLTHIKTCTLGTVPCPNANLVHDYQLSYRAGTSTLRSHLASLTQCDNANHCLPAMMFGWQGTTAISHSAVYSSIITGEMVIPGDFNGDGLTDEALVNDCGTASYPVYIGQQSFGFASSSYTLPSPNTGTYPYCLGPIINSTVLAPDGTSNVLMTINAFGPPGPPPRSQFYVSMLSTAGPLNLASYTSLSLAGHTVAGDLNGDGIIDFFSPQTATSYGFLGNGSGGFTQDGGVSASLGSVYAGDFDGDGCTDILPQGMNPAPAPNLIYAYNCNPATPTAPAPWVPNYSYFLGDYNGDGKTDILFADTSGASQLWLSTGRGFVQVSSSLPSGATVAAVGDWNGDGKADVLTDSGALYLSIGTDFTPALDSDGNPVIIPGVSGAAVVAADWDNNGNTDLLVESGSYPFATAYYRLIDYIPELMVSISNGVGSTTTIAYDRINKGSPFYSKGSSTYPTQDMIGPQYVVKEVDASNGLGTCDPVAGTNCYRTTYTYAGAKKDLRGRGFLGFSQVVATDPQTNIIQTTNYSTAFPYIGLVTSETKAHVGNIHPLSNTVSTYSNNSGCGSGISPPAGIYQVCLTQSVVSGYDLNDTAPLPTTTTGYTYDAYGDALTTNISVSDGSSKNTTNTYCTTPTCVDNWFLGRLLTTQVHSIVGSSNMTRQSSFAYDPSTGLLTQESIEPGVNSCNAGSDSCTLSTSYTYDAFGHRVTTMVYGTDITRMSYAFYDPNGEFMIAAANALGQYEFWGYDARFGTPTSHIGPNFLPTSWIYDSFGRVTQEVRPDATQTNTSYAYCSGSCPAYGQFYSRSEIDSSGGSPQIGPIVYAYYDMLSRGIANDTQGFDGGNIRVATEYDDKGRVKRTSRPYFATSGTPAWTQFCYTCYDDLGRVTQATFPDNSIATYAYDGLTTSVTRYPDPAHPQTTTTVKNAQGLNASVTDATTHTTSYSYDAFGDLLTVTDPVGNVISNSFDIRGNKIRSQDPDMGRWTYKYDVLAELTGQTDALNQTTSLEYDLLGRVTKRTENDLYSTWTYGASVPNHNVGQIVEAKTCPTFACTSIISDKTYLFDGLGRESQYILQTATDNYGYTTTYNPTNGLIASVIYPSGYTVNRSYNAIGFLTQLTDDTNIPIWTINARDAELHITSQTAGDGVTRTQSFDPNTGLIQNQRAGGGSVASFDYGFDAIGNLTSRKDGHDPNNAINESFCYDSLNRLTSYVLSVAACPQSGAGVTAVTYDAIGNITSKSDTGTYAYSGPRPHAVSGITGAVDGLTNPNYSYDGNGNLTCVSITSGCGPTAYRLINLTSFNMAASINQAATSSQASNNLSLTYDDQHQRLTQVNTVSGTATTTTVYLNDAASGAMSERVTNSGTTPTVWNGFTWGAAPWGGATANALPTWTDYITIDGQVVAQRKVTYPLASAWGMQNWNSFTWGPPPGSVWGSTAPTNPPRFKWGTDPWSGNVVAWSFFVLDHLGSIAVITDQGSNVVQRLSFDAWGKQRNPNGTAAACGTISAPTTKGFTNQEEMPTQCLVNLNARLYDASIGKFMAADTIVPDAFNGQSYNRYAYTNNNPLGFTDPTGHDIESTTSTGFRDPGYALSPGAALLGASGLIGDSDPASPHAELGRPLITIPQQSQMSKGPVSITCSRTGWNGCSGSDWLGNGYRGPENNRSRSRGEDTDANDNAQGGQGGKDEIPGCPGCYRVAENGNSIPQVQQNRLQHEIQVEREIANWQKKGFTVTRNVRFIDPTTGTPVVADYVVSMMVPNPITLFLTLRPEPIVVRDVKTGGGGLTDNQTQVYPYILKGGAVIPVGDNAARAGFQVGEPTVIRELYAGHNLPSDTLH